MKKLDTIKRGKINNSLAKGDLVIPDVMMDTANNKRGIIHIQSMKKTNYAKL